MKICKDNEGYFILTSNNQVVRIIFNGKKTTRIPLLYHFIESEWGGNYSHETVNNDYKVLFNNISKFKGLKYFVRKHLEYNYGSIDNYKLAHAEYFI